jgi:hypothetical protein
VKPDLIPRFLPAIQVDLLPKLQSAIQNISVYRPLKLAGVGGIPIIEEGFRGGQLQGSTGYNLCVQVTSSPQALVTP